MLYDVIGNIQTIVKSDFCDVLIFNTLFTGAFDRIQFSARFFNQFVHNLQDGVSKY